MSDALRARILGMLEAHSTATLATAGPEGPWAAAVFYASDAALNLYFVTDPKTRHGRDLSAGGRVAAAIHAEAKSWKEIRGLQLEGAARPLGETERPAALAVYLSKFPGIQQEPALQQRLAAIALWRLTPSLVRVIDNRERFGWKEELRLQGRA